VRLQYCEDETLRAIDWHAHAPEHNWISQGKEVSSRKLFGAPPRSKPDLPFSYREKPMVNLSWSEAVKACTRASTRKATLALPTEAEWQRAAYGTEVETDLKLRPNLGAGNFDFRRWNPVPVNASSQEQSAFAAHDMLGNGWEWTSTLFDQFPGFAPFPFYRGYSADFFDGKHFVMKGGSARTAACMLRPSFRNWFQPHYQYAYAGFRCVSR